nr:GntR family transcriptional regulator [Nocardioides panaciterrulae]
MHLSSGGVNSPRSLREQVLDALRSALIATELEPGTVYSVPALAAEFGVSPTPVREAMLDLVQQGMVEPVRNKGFRVTELSDRELDELTEIRALIEPPAIARITREVERARVEALYPDAQRIIVAAEANDLIAFVAADLSFHLGLLSLLGNRTLVDVVRDLKMRSRLYDLPEMAARGEVGECAEGHITLLDKICSGDADAAESEMLRHLAQVRGVWAGRSSRAALDRLDASRSLS